MGAKTWMISYSNGNVSDILNSNPKLDKQKTINYLKELFEDLDTETISDGDLSFTNPPKEEIYAGAYEGAFIIAATDFALDYPSKVDKKFITEKYGNTIQLHAMHSGVDWFAFATWKNKNLKRALSLSADDGILEDIGEKYEFEMPYWAGEHPAVESEDEYPFQFHPLELAEEALKYMYGYQLEGDIDETLIEPETIPLLKFKRKKQGPWWEIW